MGIQPSGSNETGHRDQNIPPTIKLQLAKIFGSDRANVCRACDDIHWTNFVSVMGRVRPLRVPAQGRGADHAGAD